jgi:WD40 repeat protein
MVLEGRLTLTRWDTKKDQLASASFPLFATAWGYLKEAPSADIDKDDAGETETKTNPPKLTVLLAGGGGSGATGVRNCLVCCEPQPPKQGETRPTFKELSRLNTGAETVGTVSISPKGDVIAVGIGDHCGIFKVAPNLKLSLFGCFKADFAEEESDMKAARFNASASILATCGEDNVLRLWDMDKILGQTPTTLEVVKVPPPHPPPPTNSPTTMAFNTTSSTSPTITITTVTAMIANPRPPPPPPRPRNVEREVER